MHIPSVHRLRMFAGAGLATLALAACTTVPAETAERPAAVETVQILGLNDFHGNLEPPAPTTWFDAGEQHREQLGGAARLGATLGQLRQGQDNTITVAAGDLISGSPLVSARYCCIS